MSGLGKFMVVFDAREAENVFEAWIGREAGKAGDWENWEILVSWPVY